VRTLEQIVEQVRTAAGGDFAFVLTRKGRLVTHRAPRDMPEEGRMRLVRAARPIVGTDRVVQVTVPREELVPYGGAAPVDVYVSVVAEQAILCVVMASWADMLRAAPAIAEGMKAIAPLLRRGLPSPRRAADVEPAKGSPYVAGRTNAPPPASVPPPESGPFVDLRASLLPEVPGDPSQPDIALGEAPLGRESFIAVHRDAITASAPEISVAEAPLGRETMVAIRREAMGGGSLPEITVGEAPLGRESMAAIRHEAGVGGSLPEITVGEAPLGRESLAAIEVDTAKGKRPSSSPDALRVELLSVPDGEVPANPRATLPWVERPARATLPWVEAPVDAKRAADAQKLGRKLASPRVTIKLEEDDAAVEIAESTKKPAKR
jgi:hypothetical protein